MYLKFLLIYSYLIVNPAECAVLSATRSRSNFDLGIGARYRAPAFKSTGYLTPAQNNFGIIKPAVNKPINSFTGNIAVNAPLKPVIAWSNANTYPNAPPRPSVWNPVPAPKPVVQNDWPYARQPAYNPHFKVVSSGPPPRLEVQKDRPYVKQQPYNPNFNVPQQPKPAILYPGPTPRPVVQSRWPPFNPHINATPKPVIQNDWLYAKQPAYNPHFKVPPTPTPANRNLGPNQRQPPYDPHFKELSGQTMQNNGPTKPSSSTSQNHLSNPKQSAYNPHFKVPPTPANQNLGPNQRQPPYSPHFKELSGQTMQNNGPTKPSSSTSQNHLSNPKQSAYNPHFKVPPTPTPANQNLGPNQREPPYNPHFKELSGQTMQSNGPTKPPSSTSQNHLSNHKQSAYKPHFKVPPTPTPANRNLSPNQPQPPYNPHFKELSGQTIQNNGPTKLPSSTSQNHLSNPKQSTYNPIFKVPPTPANQNLGPNQPQPPYNPHFKEVSVPTTLNQGSMQRQPRQNPLMPETSTIKNHLLSSMSTLYPLMTTNKQSKNDQGKNVASKFAGVLGALHTFVKKFTKNHNSTNVKQTFENPILLSTEDSEDKFPVMDLINSYSPKDSNPFSSRESLQKGLIPNKLPAVHRYNLETKQFYKGKPYILVAIVISSVVAMTALICGIIFCSKKKN